MKVAYKNQTKKFENSKNCITTEYPLKDKDLNGAIVKIKGRYPDQGRVVNFKCKELVYLIKGSVNVEVDGKSRYLNQGDMIIIYPNEKYYWSGKCTLFVACTPAWSVEQHAEVD